MSRSGYDDCYDSSEINLWRGAVASAIRGKRGQALLRDTLLALDALPQKRLIKSALVTAEGECCTMGAAALQRGIDVSNVDPYERDEVAEALDIASALAAEIAYENDERAPVSLRGPVLWDENGRYYRPEETPEERFVRMRAWVVANIVVTADELLPLEAAQ